MTKLIKKTTKANTRRKNKKCTRHKTRRRTNLLVQSSGHRLTYYIRTIGPNVSERYACATQLVVVSDWMTRCVAANQNILQNTTHPSSLYVFNNFCHERNIGSYKYLCQIFNHNFEFYSLLFLFNDFVL